ncbi:MAG: efflux RND transporter periplasmic adaptor subunit [Spirochaetales bacterium]
MKKSSILLLAVGTILVAGGAWYFFARQQPEQATVSSGPVTVTAKNGVVSIDVEGVSLVEPAAQVTLRSTAASLVKSLVREGSRVAAGAVVATLDDTQFRNALGQAEFVLSQAQVDLKKAQLVLDRAVKDKADKKALLDGKALSPGDYATAEEAVTNAQLAGETAELKVGQSRLSLDKSRNDLASLSLRAPFDGTVLKAYLAAGDLVSPNTAVVLFGDLSRVRLSAEVDENDIGKVVLGQTVAISGEAMGEESLVAKVEAISPMAEVVNNISIFKVTALVDNTEGRLRPGMSADFSIRIASDKGVVVPSKAVSTVRSRSYVEVLENGEVVKKRVEKGADDGLNAVILSGLDEGTEVVLPGAVKPSAPAPTAAAGEKSVLPITIPGSGGTK